MSSVPQVVLTESLATIESWMTYCFALLRAEIELYKALEPATRLVILKAICDIRGEVCAHIIPVKSFNDRGEPHSVMFLCGIRPTFLLRYIFHS